jgi:hypothetical protein
MVPVTWETEELRDKSAPRKKNRYLMVKEGGLYPDKFKIYRERKQEFS